MASDTQPHVTQDADDDGLAVEVDDDTLLFWLLMAKRHGRTLDDEVKLYLSEFYRQNAWETGGLDPDAISPEAFGEPRSPSTMNPRVRSLLRDLSPSDDLG